MRTIEQLAQALADGQHHQPRAGGGQPGADRRPGRRGRAGLHTGLCRLRAGDGRCDGRAAPSRAGAVALGRHPGRAEGPVRRGRRPHAGRVARAGRRAAGRGTCAGGAAHAGGGVRAAGADQHDGVRLLRPGDQPALRHAAQPVGPAGAADPGRQFVRHRGGGGRRHGGGRAGHRYRRVVPHPGGVLRHRRLQADRAAGADRRRAAAGAQPGLGRAAGAVGGLLRGDRRGAGRCAAGRCRCRRRWPGCGWRCRRTWCWTAWTMRSPTAFDRALAALADGRRARIERRRFAAFDDAAGGERQGRVRGRPRPMPGIAACWPAQAPATIRASACASSAARRWMPPTTWTWSPPALG